ncbi:hypothetical protein Dfer_1577 [Dyadobacter fermentans DSM 18053]|uniref:Uncharacterized protein n=1 Tax=Dyadobacter fermentans (strain ATCC 700827 / DSM 18053 / CIP 107007 / KCTC 52180 / NS114) TaxID=471854 RepID=C6VSJ8_DYAFD|nr:hypothetical protein Dfer_1577 [Dyadobacter fermentans DSM 18053]
MFRKTATGRWKQRPAIKRSIFLLMLIAFFLSCREKAIDPSRLVRPVALKISVANDAYQLSWQEIRFR